MSTSNEREVTVLLVDDDPDDISIIRRLLAQYPRVHFKVLAAASLGACMELLEAEGADILMLDYALPAEDGISFLRRAAALLALPPVIIVTGQNDYRLVAEAIRCGAADCIYKFGMTSQMLGQAVQQALAKFNDDLTLSQFDENVIAALVETARNNDPTTGGIRLARLAVNLGKAMGLSERQIELLRYGALLHDIGKLGVRNELIRKPASLTEAEFAEIRLHPLIGERLCAPLRLSRDLAPIIRHHHERWDGGGYVDGLVRDETPMLARVISVVDAFDAMTSDRPYRAALAYDVALERLEAGADSQWDPDIVGVFINEVSDGFFRARAA